MSTVLLIDEHPHLLDALRARFEREGFMVECATTGELGLAHALNDRPGLIVVDEGISLEGGVPLAGLLNHHRELSGIPVIVLSRRDSGSSASLAQGQPSRLTLPFRPSQLLALVREAL